MHKSVLIENVAQITKQRNLFLATSALMLVSNLFLGIKVATVDQKIVLVPALRQEMMVSKSGVSKSYIEEMSLLFLSNLLDLSPSDIGHKKELILKYTSNSDKKALDRLIDYFMTSERNYKRFDLTTYFSVKNLEIDLENLSVIAHGVLTSYYGKAGHESENEDYKLDFEFQGGNLRLKSFVRLVDADKKKRDQSKSLKFETEAENGDVLTESRAVSDQPNDQTQSNHMEDATGLEYKTNASDKTYKEVTESTNNDEGKAK